MPVSCIHTAGVASSKLASPTNTRTVHLKYKKAKSIDLAFLLSRLIFLQNFTREVCQSRTFSTSQCDVPAMRPALETIYGVGHAG